LENPRNTKNKIRKELSKPIYPPFSDNIGSKYRYPNSKAQYIVKTAIEIYTKGNLSIRDILIGCNDGIEARNILMEKCFGIGPKQASLFLRNISFSNDLAIIDSHVDHYMKLLKSGGKMVKMNKQEVCPYFEKENALRIYAMSKKRSLATLDIGIWTVMRVIRKKD
jgi:N-glycosylase/DNA lyase